MEKQTAFHMLALIEDLTTTSLEDARARQKNFRELITRLDTLEFLLSKKPNTPSDVDITLSTLGRVVGWCKKTYLHIPALVLGFHYMFHFLEKR